MENSIEKCRDAGVIAQEINFIKERTKQNCLMRSFYQIELFASSISIQYIYCMCICNTYTVYVLFICIYLCLRTVDILIDGCLRIPP